MNDKNNNTMVIRIELDTYHKLDELRSKKKIKNLQEFGQVGDADFDGIINDLLTKNNGNNNQQKGEKEDLGGGDVEGNDR